MSEALALGVPQQASAVAVDALPRILRQTLEAALFEGLLDYIVVPRRERPSRWCTLYFRLGKVDYACPGRVRGFGRIRLQLSGLTRVQPVARRPDLEEMLRQLLVCLPGDAERKQALTRELNQTRIWCQWNARELPPPEVRRELPLVELEGALREGHPYHPCFKARIGLTETDYQRYSPEAAGPLRPHWIAVPRARVVGAGAAQDPDAFAVRELGPALFQALRARCRARGADPDQQVFVPVHPWQWQHRILPRTQGSNPRLLDLGQPGDDYRVCQSMRTLMNRARPERADLKLPLDIVLTSSRRHLLSHGIDSGPALSDWLAGTVAGDGFFEQQPLMILREYAGLRVEETGLLSPNEPGICQLGALWRESLPSRLAPGERAVPAQVLALMESDGKPFIDPWVNAYGLEPWLTRLFDTLILPVWHLLARHGIALEAHGQNLLLVHRDGWPQWLAARDFHESVEYVEDFLAAPEAAPAFRHQARYADARPNEYYWMDSVEALRELVMDTLFVFQLSELAALCEDYYRLPETRFWALVRTCLARYAGGGHCDPARLEALGYRAPMVQVESLLRKKLCGVQPEYHHRVFNPLSETARKEA